MSDSDLPVLPFDRPNVLDPAPLFRVLQADRPVARVRTPAGDLAWLVTRYEDVKTLLTDDRLARSASCPRSCTTVLQLRVLGWSRREL
jgi:pentalenolactone synthase